MKFKLTAAPVFAILVAFTTNANSADKSYTKAQLNEMVKSGKYPPQLPPQEKTETIEFPACVAMTRKTVADVRDNYPARIMVDTPILLSAKIWTNDGAIVMTCSKDGKLVMQQSKYK